RKSPPLDDGDWWLLKTHPTRSAELVERIHCARDAAAAIAAHHEAWDGSGYPRGLVGEAIPLDARIVAVADAFVSMTTTRAYRPALTTTAALTEIWRRNGRSYDPAVVSALFTVARESGLPEAPAEAALALA